MLEKNIESEVIFIKREMNNDWNINFLQNSLLDNAHGYSSKFSIGWSVP